LEALSTLRHELERFDKRLNNLMHRRRDVAVIPSTSGFAPLADMQAVLGEFQQRGNSDQDLERGLVDFPAIIGDRSLSMLGAGRGRHRILARPRQRFSGASGCSSSDASSPLLPFQTKTVMEKCDEASHPPKLTCRQGCSAPGRGMPADRISARPARRARPADTALRRLSALLLSGSAGKSLLVAHDDIRPGIPFKSAVATCVPTPESSSIRCGM